MTFVNNRDFQLMQIETNNSSDTLVGYLFRVIKRFLLPGEEVGRPNDNGEFSISNDDKNVEGFSIKRNESI